MKTFDDLGDIADPSDDLHATVSGSVSGFIGPLHEKWRKSGVPLLRSQCQERASIAATSKDGHTFTFARPAPRAVGSFVKTPRATTLRVK